MQISYTYVQWFQSHSHPKMFSILGGGHFEKWVKIMFLMQGFLGAFLGMDTSTTVNSKLLELVCLQFCLGSPYIWALLTRLFRDVNEKNHYANSTQNPNVIHLHEHTYFNSYAIVYISTYMSTCAHFKSTIMTPNYVKPIMIKCGLGAPYSNRD